MDKSLPQDEERLDELSTNVQQHGRVLPIAVARDCGCLVAACRDSEVPAALKVLFGLDADPTHECTRAINRPRSLPPQEISHPGNQRHALLTPGVLRAFVPQTTRPRLHPTLGHRHKPAQNPGTSRKRASAGPRSPAETNRRYGPVVQPGPSRHGSLRAAHPGCALLAVGTLLPAGLVPGVAGSAFGVLPARG